MPIHERVEVHFGDGHVEVVDDVSKGRDIIRQRHDPLAQIWVVSPHNLGLGKRVRAYLPLQRPEPRECTREARMGVIEGGAAMINPFLVASIEATRYAREALDAYRESEWADPDQVDEAVWTIGRYLTEAKGLLDDLYARQASSSQPDRGR